MVKVEDFVRFGGFLHTGSIPSVSQMQKFITLQHTATHCNTLQRTATSPRAYRLCEFVTLFYTALHCNTLQHTATHCSTLQHTAAHCRTLQNTAAHCRTLQHTAAHCNTMQRTTTLPRACRLRAFVTLFSYFVLLHADRMISA